MSEKLADSTFGTGAVRSADVSHLDFASMPLLGLLAVMRVAGGGGTKYGRFNYLKGMPIHETLNHVAVHLIRYLLGDRSEPHLAKVAWGAMVADQTAFLNPELASPHLLGPGALLTAGILEEMDRGKPERDAMRQAGEFEALFNWTLGDMPEVQQLVEIRAQPPYDRAHKSTPNAEVDDEGFIVVPSSKSGEPSHVDPEGSHPVDQAYRRNQKIRPSSEGGDHAGGCPPLP